MGWLTGGLKVVVVSCGATYDATKRLTVSAAEGRRLYGIRAQLEIVFPHMTKTDVLTAGAGGDHIPDLHLCVGDDYAGNEALYQRPLLRERGGR
jgi:hypothetical protein